MSILELVLIVTLMGAVTYLPRLLPLVLLTNLKLNPFLRNLLQFIPFAVLGALIFPGILSSTDNPYSALFGAAIAFVLAYLRFNVIFVILGGIMGVYLFINIYQ